ncbi:hypothetical protein [Sinomicrobium sp. M5D2P9]
MHKKNRISRKIFGLCALVFMTGSMSVSGQNITTNSKEEIIEMVERFNNPPNPMNPVEQMVYDNRFDWFEADREPDWIKIKNGFLKKYPEMNIDSLTVRTKFSYFSFLDDSENRIKALAYLANEYGERWLPDDLTRYARDVIRFDFGHDQDALRWTQLALEKLRREHQIQTQESGGSYIEEKRHTLSRILAKLGQKEEALKYIAEAMPYYSLDGLYLELDGTYGRGLFKKRAISDLFEVLTDRGRWLDIAQKEALYKGKVDFYKDKINWHRVRDQYLLKEFPPREADSLMYLGAMYYYVSYVKDTLAWAKPFVEYAETYGNIDVTHKNQHAWELFKKSDQPEILKKALKWSSEVLNEKNNPNRYAHLDTYANLQYKLGNKAEAMESIKEAISLAPDTQKAAFIETREKMKKGEKTW